jgi:AcrR family transcriptional regulator
MTVFWGKGYEGASLEEPQSAMGAISPPSFYAAFRSKELVFFEAVDLYLETVGHRPRQALESAVTARGCPSDAARGGGIRSGPCPELGCFAS